MGERQDPSRSRHRVSSLLLRVGAHGIEIDLIQRHPADTIGEMFVSC